MSKDLRGFWDEHASSEVMLSRNFSGTIIPHCGDLRGLAVLELGCGAGSLSREMARLGASVTAVDFSPEMVASSNRLGSDGVEFLCSDVLELDLGRRFDLIVGRSFLAPPHLLWVG